MERKFMSENVHHNLADEKRICTESVQIQTGLALRNIYIGRSIREEWGFPKTSTENLFHDLMINIHEPLPHWLIRTIQGDWNAWLYCFTQFWTIHEKNYDTVPAVSPPFRSFIFLSLLNILAFSIFDSLILRSSSGLPL